MHPELVSTTLVAAPRPRRSAQRLAARSPGRARHAANGERCALVLSDLAYAVIGGRVTAGSVVRVVADGAGVRLLAGTRAEVEAGVARLTVPNATSDESVEAASV